MKKQRLYIKDIIIRSTLLVSFAFNAKGQIQRMVNEPLEKSKTGIIKGQIKDRKGDLIEHVVIKVNKGKKLMAGAISDLEGYYSIKPINKGIYTIIYSHEGYKTDTIKNVSVFKGKTKIINIILDNAAGTGEPIIIQTHTDMATIPAAIRDQLK